MGTVTIAATYGAGGSVIAPAVAERLGLPLIDRAIPVALAHELAAPLQEALSGDERPVPGLVVRVLERAVDLSGIYMGVPVPPQLVCSGTDRMATTEQALRKVADHRGAVMLGRAGVFVLRDRRDTLHVRLDGPVAARRRQAMRHEGVDAETAALLQRETDRARSAYIAYFYPNEHWEDPANYHLVIDTTALPLDACTDMVVTAARALFGSLTPAAPAV